MQSYWGPRSLKYVRNIKIAVNCWNTDTWNVAGNEAARKAEMMGGLCAKLKNLNYILKTMGSLLKKKNNFLYCEWNKKNFQKVRSFGFFRNILRKNSNELFGQPNTIMSAGSPTILRAVKNEVPVCVPSQSHRVHSFYCYCVRILFNCAHTQICIRTGFRLGFKKLFPSMNIK